MKDLPDADRLMVVQAVRRGALPIEDRLDEPAMAWIAHQRRGGSLGVREWFAPGLIIAVSLSAFVLDKDLAFEVETIGVGLGLVGLGLAARRHVRLRWLAAQIRARVGQEDPNEPDDSHTADRPVSRSALRWSERLRPWRALIVMLAGVLLIAFGASVAIGLPTVWGARW
ncbi:hypothetical protein AB0L06_40715 [Spirillospora sp. NPDC052269]